LLVTTVSLNLAVLGVFKYAGFAVGNFNVVMASFGMRPFAVPEVLLPIGISFFTFHAISYVVDVYRRDASAQKHPVEAALYLLVFPQLIAGPIIRWRDIADQIPSRAARLADFAYGARRFVLGLGKKVLIANTVGQVADRIFGLPAGELTTPLSWLGLVCYTLQIYFDFSGYSDMAIGLALLFGIRLPVNFRSPYKALSIIEFWRRWHITLSRFLRDYLYIPLGGNRGGKARQICNILITMLLGGLWHGANWTFVIWGGLHGVALGFVHLVSKYTSAMPRWLSWLLTFHFVTFAWIFFRARDFASAQRFIAETFTNAWSTAGADIERNAFVVILIVVFALTHWLDRHARLRVAVRRANPLFVWLGITFCWMLAITVSQGSSANFIYFDF
jgi:alginate O-acetyltransferase complex protein AlgI